MEVLPLSSCPSLFCEDDATGLFKSDALHVLGPLRLDQPLLKRQYHMCVGLDICMAEKAVCVARCCTGRCISPGRDAGGGPGCRRRRPRSGLWGPAEGSTHHHRKQVTPCLQLMRPLTLTSAEVVRAWLPVSFEFFSWIPALCKVRGRRGEFGSAEQLRRRRSLQLRWAVAPGPPAWKQSAAGR